MPSEYESLQDLLAQKRENINRLEQQVGELEQQVAAATPLAIKASHNNHVRNICVFLSCTFASPLVFVAAMAASGARPQPENEILTYAMTTVFAGLAALFGYRANYFHNRARSYNAQARPQ